MCDEIARGRKALYDAACKRVLSNKAILAWILKGLLTEFRGCSVKEIASTCIEGDPLLGARAGSGVTAMGTRVSRRRLTLVLTLTNGAWTDGTRITDL